MASIAVSSSTTFSYVPTILSRIESGPGCLSKLTEICKDLSISTPLIVTGQSIATKTDIIERTKSLLPSTAGVFSKIGAHAPIGDVHKGLALLRDSNGDGLIAVGGGSPIDASKAMISFYQKETGKTLKLISIPTTLSAAELTLGFGYTDETGKKTGGRGFTSSAIIYDAELALHTPNKLWVSTGMRAVDHAVEQQIRPAASIPVKAMAREALSILFEALRACAKDERDVQARQRAFTGASMSLWSDAKIAGIGLSHTLGYQLGSPYSIPHGTCSCLTLGPTISAMAKHLSKNDLHSIASLLSYVDPITATTLASSSDVEKVQAVARAITQLVSETGVSAKLSDYKVPKEDLPGIVERGLKPLKKDKSDPMFDDVLKGLESVY